MRVAEGFVKQNLNVGSPNVRNILSFRNSLPMEASFSRLFLVENFICCGNITFLTLTGTHLQLHFSLLQVYSACCTWPNYLGCDLSVDYQFMMLSVCCISVNYRCHLPTGQRGSYSHWTDSAAQTRWPCYMGSVQTPI